MGQEEREGFKGFFLIFKHSWVPRRSWKISHGGPGKSWKSPGFLVSKRVGTPLLCLGSFSKIWHLSGFLHLATRRSQAVPISLSLKSILHANFVQNR